MVDKTDIMCYVAMLHCAADDKDTRKRRDAMESATGSAEGLAAKKDWQIGESEEAVVKFFNRATVHGKHSLMYGQGEGYGFAKVGNTEYFFHDSGRLAIEAGGDDLFLSLKTSTPHERVVELSSGSRIVVLEIGPGRNDQTTILKWCKAEELELAKQELREAPLWRVVLREDCEEVGWKADLLKAGKEDELYWEGNNEHALRCYLVKYHSTFVAYRHKISGLESLKLKPVFFLEQQQEDGSWIQPELEAYPAGVYKLCCQAGFCFEEPAYT